MSRPAESCLDRCLELNKRSLKNKEMPAAFLIRAYTPQDQDDVAALFDRYFGPWSRQRWLQRWKWQYRDSQRPPGAESHIQVVEADGRVVGHLGAFPLTLRVGDERLGMLSAGDFVVAEGHRLAAFGLLKNLVSQGRVVIATGSGPEGRRMLGLHKAVTLPISEVRYVYPLRHRNETYGELRARAPRGLRWAANRWSAALVAPILDRRRGRRPKRRPRVKRGCDIRTILRFGEDYDALWQRAARQFDVSLDKDARYLNWRYNECPTLTPICLGSYDERGELSGVAIASVRVGRDLLRQRYGRDGEIMELIVREARPELAKPLIVSAVEALDRKGVDVVAATGLCTWLHPILEEIGFERTTCDWNTLYAISHRADRPIGPIIQNARWYYTGGDGDSLFTYTL